jgi:hypothetical protein
MQTALSSAQQGQLTMATIRTGWRLEVTRDGTNGCQDSYENPCSSAVVWLLYGLNNLESVSSDKSSATELQHEEQVISRRNLPPGIINDTSVSPTSFHDSLLDPRPSPSKREGIPRALLHHNLLHLLLQFTSQKNQLKTMLRV